MSDDQTPRIILLTRELANERAAHARTQAWLDRFQGDVAAKTVETMRLERERDEARRELALVRKDLAEAERDLIATRVSYAHALMLVDGINNVVDQIEALTADAKPGTLSYDVHAMLRARGAS